MDSLKKCEVEPFCYAVFLRSVMYSETVYGALVSKVCFEVFINVFSPYIRVEDFDHSVQMISDKGLILD